METFLRVPTGSRTAIWISLLDLRKGRSPCDVYETMTASRTTMNCAQLARDRRAMSS